MSFKFRNKLRLLVCLLANWSFLSAAQDIVARDNGVKRSKRDAAKLEQPADVRSLDRFSVILGRPTSSSITANVLSDQSQQCYLEYWYGVTDQVHSSGTTEFIANQPSEVELIDLESDREYFYRPRCRKPNEADFGVGAVGRFRTQRKTGQSFVFELQGDSHPERPQQFNADLYAQTLRSAAKDHPDFYIAMGDDFSVDTLDNISQDTVAQRYRLQRPYLALVGKTAPIFLVNGNHEQAAAVNLDGTPNNVAVWAQRSRNAFYSQPGPDYFYSGNAVAVPHIGLLRNYFGWTWGDALFLVIDPYWHSSEAVDNLAGKREKGSQRLENVSRAWRDMWNITLGDAQYQWFKHALETTNARYKFVFAHHVLGTGRGGVEQAGLFEWGGKDRRGVDAFALHRPGWDLPIHQLMVKHGVTAFFQGHDHVYAHQQLDGVTYQTLPQPADPNYAINYESAYRVGEILPSSGRVRVTVRPDDVKVEYVRSFLPKDSTLAHPDQEIAHSYVIAPKGR